MKPVRLADTEVRQKLPVRIAGSITAFQARSEKTRLNNFGVRDGVRRRYLSPMQVMIPPAAGWYCRLIKANVAEVMAEFAMAVDGFFLL